MSDRTFSAIYDDSLTFLQRARKYLQRKDASSADQIFEELLATTEELSIACEEMSVQNARLLEAQDEIKAKQAQYKELFDQAPVAYVLTDIHGVIKLANSAAATLLGVDKDKLAGKPMALYLLENQQRQFYSIINELQTLEPRSNLEWETVVQTRAGNNVPVLVQLCYDSSQNGSERQMRWTILDLTNRKQLEQTALDKVQLCQDFVAALMHDLKGPTVGAQGVLEAFVKGEVGKLSDEQHDILHKLSQSNQQLLRSIQTLLDIYCLTSLGSDEKFWEQKELEDVDLSNVLESCIQAASVAGLKKEITIDFTVEKNMPVFKGRTADLKRVLLSLLDNAVKFSPKGCKVMVEAFRKESGELLIAVSDQGCGIPLEDQTKIFQRFWTSDSRGKYPASTGLGLFLCRKIVEAYGGRVFCKSEPGAGSRFTVEVPWNEAHRIQAPEAGEAP